ncbi:glutamate-cysteine ligase family protein, partial [Streptococcus sp. DD11]|uniref:glutamate-cysteine ligase family protein n=1 Tax=Streptococcus sp. DD11 TaxID=1777879 RepID=UPI000AF877FB
MDSIQILKERYLKNIQENPHLYIGIELEFPIVNCLGGATDTEVAKALLKRLASDYPFEIERTDREGNPIQLKSRENEDRLLFELSYNTLEFAFEKADVIQEVDERFQQYLALIQPILQENHHEIQGEGLHPFWQENDNRPVNYPRYEMLMQYLALSKQTMAEGLHGYPEYGAFICGSQVQLDVSKSNYLRVINVFNQIEAAKAYLFANSAFDLWDTKISRDRFWEDSMHGILRENVGVNPVDFASEKEFFDYLNRSAIFTAEREGETYYFYPIAAAVYLEQENIKAYDLTGREVILTPSAADFSSHRSYQYQDLTTRGTVEFRSTCTQPLARTFAPAAFHLGILANLEQAEIYLQTCSFFKKEGRDYQQLRRRFSGKHLSEEEREQIEKFSDDLVRIAAEGLQFRKKGEEKYLFCLQ